MQTGIATRRECKSCVRASVCEWLVASGEWLLSEEWMNTWSFNLVPRARYPHATWGHAQDDDDEHLLLLRLLQCNAM